MYMEFSGGQVTKDLTPIKTKGKRGTTVTFIPDDQYFEDKFSKQQEEDEN